MTRLIHLSKDSVNGAALIKKRIKKVVIYLFLAVCCLIVLFPFYIAVVTSFKPTAEANNLDFTWWPKEFTFKGYLDVFTYKGGNTVSMPLLLLGFINTLWMILPRSLISTLLAGMAAYAYAKLKFRYKNLMFGFLMVTMMVPGVITLIPSYMLFYKLNWLSTPLPIILPALLGGTSCVFFMRQYYMSVPDELTESASMDGLGYFEIYFRIMLPIGMPAFWAQFVLAFVGGYNEYLGPMLYLKNAGMLTLQLALSQFSSSRSRDPGSVMAAAIVALVPTVALFIVAQKQFISGIVTSGLKL